MPTLLHRLILFLVLCAGAASLPLRGEDFAPANGDYRIAPRDLLQFQMYEEPDMAVAQRVTASGEVRLPLIGTVNVAGMTLRAAEEHLRRRYIEEGFYINPQVILSLQQYDDRTVSVLGQVNKPDAIPFPLEQRTISLARAITLAGGLTRLARADSIQITRRGPKGEDERFVLNLESALSNKPGAKGADFELQPGDVVFVPERTF